jgi:ADP-ribosylglycohydrolase
MPERDRARGAFVGAAIGDAMGGPVEGSHAERIRRLVGGIAGLLPYREPWIFNGPRPGYCVRPEAGCVTDDTFIRGDFVRFYLDTPPSRTPRDLVTWMLANADFTKWYQPSIEGLRRVERGEATVEDGGRSFFQGGGLGWWTPIGILRMGHPALAAAEVRRFCRIWKAPLEEDLLAAVVAGIAEAGRDGAGVDSVVAVMRGECGSLGRALLDRAVAAARAATDEDDLIRRIYAEMLMPELEVRDREEPPRDRDGPLPAVRAPIADSDAKYMSSFFAEQVPIALAAFVFARGEARAIPLTCLIGRDCDSTATTVGAWVGALHGEAGLPPEWVQLVLDENVPEIALSPMADALFDLAAREAAGHA